MPAGIARLASLRELALDGNPLEAVPDEVCELRELRKLVLHGCRLHALPDGLGALVALEQLLVSSNRLAALPDSIGGCSRLRVLACNNNELTGLPAALAALPALTSVNAANNAIAGLPAALAQRWRAVLPADVVEASLEAEGERGDPAAAAAALPQPPASLAVILDRNPLLAGAEAVKAISASQVGLQSIVEELRGRKKAKQ